VVLGCKDFCRWLGKNAARTLRVRDSGWYTESVVRTSLVLVVLSIGGCGGGGGRQAIEGSVTLDGKPMEKGQITFVPQGDTKGPTAGAEVVGGKFAIAAVGGPFWGKFRVEITASRPGGRKVPDRMTGRLVDAYEQFIPARYNTESQLIADVKSGQPNRYEFAVNSK
jgi:hypothetical protein